LVKPSVTIAWPARSRDISAPVSALSATIIFRGAAADGTDVLAVVNRPSSSDAIRQTTSFTSMVHTGAQNIDVIFFAGTNATGSNVAEANAAVKVSPAGTLTNPDGSALGTITFNSRIDQIVIQTTTLVLGAPVTPIYSVRAIDRSVIAVPPGSATFTATPDGGTATVTNGTVIGTSLGDVNLTATIDGVKSFSAVLEVQPPALSVAPRTLGMTTNWIVANPKTGTIWASVPGSASKYANNVVEIDPATGTVKGSVFVGSEPNVLAISDDGSELYVGLDGAAAICRVDTASRTVSATFSLALSGPFNNTQFRASDIQVEPSHPDVIAVTTAGIGSSLVYGPTLYSGGVALPNPGGQPSGNSSAFVSPTRLWTSEQTDLAQYSIDATGATRLTSVNETLESLQLKAFGGTLYTDQGGIYSGGTGASLGSFNVSSPDSFTVDSGFAYFVELTPNGEIWLATFNVGTQNSFALNMIHGETMFQNFAGRGQTSVCRWGSKGLAFRTGTKIYFIDHAPGL